MLIDLKGNPNRKKNDRYPVIFLTGLLIFLSVSGVSVPALNVCARGSISGTAGTAGAVTRYVDLGREKDGKGTESDPRNSIESALRSAGPGTEVIVSGTSEGREINITGIRGTASKPVRIISDKDDPAVLKGKNNCKENSDVVCIYDCSYVELDGFTICDNRTGSEGVDVAGIRIIGNEYKTDHITVENCEIYGISCGGAYGEKHADNENVNAHAVAVISNAAGAGEMKGITLKADKIHDCELGQSETLVINGNVSDFRILCNTIYSNDNIGIDMAGYEDEGGMSRTNRARNGLCAGNIVCDISSEDNMGYTDCSADGIYIDGGTGNTVKDNILINDDIGIELACEHKGMKTDMNKVQNNLVIGCNRLAGISLGGSSKGNGSSEDNVISGNTVADSGRGESACLMLQQILGGTNMISDNLFTDDGTFIAYSEEDYGRLSGKYMNVKGRPRNLFTGNLFCGSADGFYPGSAGKILRGQISSDVPETDDTDVNSLINIIKKETAASKDVTDKVRTLYAGMDKGYSAKKAAADREKYLK
jgi:hypothetical protein